MKDYIINKNGDKYEFEHSKSLTKKEKMFYVRIYEEFVKLISDEWRKGGNNKEQRIKALEDNLYKVIQKYPELLYIKKYNHQVTSTSYGMHSYYDYSHTFLYEIKFYGLYNLIEKLCENVEVCKMATFDNNTLFFDLLPEKPDPKYQHTIDRYNEKTKRIISILDKHPELLSFKNQWGDNFAGEIISNFESNNEYIKPFMPYILASLHNPAIATQTNNNGYNLGMLCAYYQHQELFNIAFQNPTARAQKNDVGDTMEMIANNNGLIVPPLTDKQVYDFYNEIISKKVEEICK